MDRDSHRWRASKLRESKKRKHRSDNLKRRPGVENLPKPNPDLRTPVVLGVEVEPVAGPSGVKTRPVQESQISGHGCPSALAATESFGKLSLFDMMCTPEEKAAQNETEDQFLLVHSTSWNELLKNFACSECGEKSIEAQIREQKGFCAKIVAKCTACGFRMGDTHTSQRVKGSTTRPPFEVNRRIVDATNAVGLGHAGLEKFCTVMSMKGMSSSTYKAHLDKLATETEKLADRVLDKARKAVRKVHETIDPSLKNKDVLDIAVSYDGTWHKRGFTSLYGIGVVIDILTGLVIDYQVLSKFCQMCAIASSQLDAESPDFQLWQQGHKDCGECSVNYIGSSVAMEMKAAEILWTRSLARNQMRYTTVLSDGDAKTYTQLQNIAPYGKDVPISKEECVNHITKRMGTGLRNLVKEWKIKGITLGGRGSGMLKETTIVALTNYYRNAIVKNIPDVSAMKKAIRATVDHCASTDDNPQHSNCPTGTGTWCFFNKSTANGEPPKSHDTMPVKLNATVVAKLTPLYERLSSDELLSRCARGATQNANESLHSLIWRKCPKETSTSKKRIDLGVVSAVAEFNMGAIHAQKAKMMVRERVVPDAAKNISAQRDARRKRKRAWKATTESKKARKATNIRKTAAEKAKKQAEGPTYSAGQF